MHTVTIRSKFAFGDRVRFDSPTQGCAGSGKVFAITVDKYGNHHFMIAINGDEAELQPGILEEEMTLLGER